MENKLILQELKKILTDNYGTLIEKVIMFGSRIDGTAREYSDYDILIILKSDYDWRLENDILNICNEINLKYDILLDVKIISETELAGKRGMQPYIQDAVSAGLSL